MLQRAGAAVVIAGAARGRAAARDRGAPPTRAAQARPQDGALRDRGAVDRSARVRADREGRRRPARLAEVGPEFRSSRGAGARPQNAGYVTADVPSPALAFPRRSRISSRPPGNLSAPLRRGARVAARSRSSYRSLLVALRPTRGARLVVGTAPPQRAGSSMVPCFIFDQEEPAAARYPRRGEGQRGRHATGRAEASSRAIRSTCERHGCSDVDGRIRYGLLRLRDRAGKPRRRSYLTRCGQSDRGGPGARSRDAA